MSDEKIDSAMIRALAALLDETRLTEVEIERDGWRVRVARQPAPAQAATYAIAPQPHHPVMAASDAVHPGALTSPMVGTIYLAPEPGAAPFVTVGDMVIIGQTLFIIEAMKTMNPITAHRAGKLTRILVNDGHPVEFGEQLAIID